MKHSQDIIWYYSVGNLVRIESFLWHGQFSLIMYKSKFNQVVFNDTINHTWWNILDISVYVSGVFM